MAALPGGVEARHWAAAAAVAKDLADSMDSSARGRVAGALSTAASQHDGVPALADALHAFSS
eukprot:364100-Chlamydomonas_euryale.AAC.55